MPLNNLQPLREPDKDEKCCKYGWFNYRPACLQSLRHPWIALAILSACAFIQGFLVSGLVNVCISSVEKQFKLTSTQTGSVVSAYDIAFLIVATPISYAGGRHGSSKVRYLTAGMAALGLGSLVFASPQFISPPYSYRSVSEICSFNTLPLTTPRNGDANDGFAISFSRGSFPYFLTFFLGSFLNGVGGAPLYTLGITYVDENSPAESVSFYLGIYYAFSMVGPAFGFFFGAYVLTFYVDFVKYSLLSIRNKSIWPQKLVPPTFTIEPDQTPGPNWVGAWWLGFVTCATLAWIMAIPLSGLPSRFPGMLEKFVARRGQATLGELKTGSKDSQPDKVVINQPFKDSTLPGSSNMDTSLISRIKSVYGSVLANTLALFGSLRLLTTGENGNKWPKNAKLPPIPAAIQKSTFFRSLSSLLLNGTFMSITMAGAADGFILNGFAAFLPKYLEMQFGLSAKQASLYVGYATIPAGVLGMLLGGYVIKRFNVTVMGMLRITFVASLCNFSCLLVLLMTCPENRLAGVNYMPAYVRPPKTFLNYTFTDNDDWYKSRQKLTNEAKIDFDCNHGCKCHHTYDPVCGSNNVMYYSACHAGCQGKSQGPTSPSSRISYHNCTCIQNMLNDRPNEWLIGSARPGACPVLCGNLLLFLSFIFISLFLLLMVAVIAVMITLKCVASNENSLSMGVQWAFVRLLGTIPGPIVFGKIIDRNCLFWEVKATIPLTSPFASQSAFEPSSSMVPSSLVLPENGACKLYNNYAMGRDIFFLMVVSKISSQIFYGLACFAHSRVAPTLQQTRSETKVTISDLREKSPSRDPKLCNFEEDSQRKPFASLRVTTYPDLSIHVARTGSLDKSWSSDSIRPSNVNKSFRLPRDRAKTYSR